MTDVLDAEKGPFQQGTPEYEALANRVKQAAINKVLIYQEKKLDAMHAQMYKIVQETLHWERVQQRVGNSSRTLNTKSRGGDTVARESRRLREVILLLLQLTSAVSV